ncbi:SMI1/KNR4 family protein [Formosa sp. PL04]|uniref:SMI1/KNR4 family protein n=1 Tax=Formosa sp. PL04 TaxID=3081755 RepID=UPI002982772E|nr:SMI1/KNR4 family protein [Formosa sp. PL04]MDW5289673.1 SMI1/KNR4 family protein [Formosa sp. PL04]
MNNSITYSEDFKLLKWDDFNFEPIQIKTLPILEDPEHYKNSFTFRDALLEAIETRSGKNVFKLLLITPDYKSSTKFYGIGYLEDKTVFTVEIENTPLFEEWFININYFRSKDNDEKFIKSVYNFSKSCYSSQPASNLKNITFQENTGAFIDEFIPNQFIAEKLAKEKADFLSPFIHLEAEINLEEVKQSFNALIAEKDLTIHPPKNNDAIYDAFAKEAGFPFPQIIKDYLTLHNGIDRCAIMDAETIYNEWKDWKTCYDDWTQEDLFNTFYINEGKALLMYTTPYWVPFFDLQNGNFLAFDFAPNTKGTAGQIIRYGADLETGYIEDEDLNTFLKSLMGTEGEIEENEWFYIE